MTKDSAGRPAAEADIAADEILLWSEHPRVKSALVAPATIGPVLVVVLLATTMIYGALGIEAGPLPFGVMLLIVAAILLSNVHAVQGTVYFITNRRLIISERFGRATTSIRLDRLIHVERIRRGSLVTVRIPIDVVDSDGGPKVHYLKLRGLRDGERAFALLTQTTA